MADVVIKQNDTWPPLRGAAADEDGLMDLSAADSLRFIMKSGQTLVDGSATAIEPPDEDGFNWSYTWGTADTSVVGTYQAELEITWDAGPPVKIETVPNEGTLEIEIEAEQD